MRLIFALMSVVVIAACSPTPAPPPSSGSATTAAPVAPPMVPARLAAKNFVSVVDSVEPVAERICRAEAPGAKCDFQIVVDQRPDQPPNAYQTLDKAGRPIIAFTVSLIAETRNRDEIAFIIGHEAAHHIAGHLARRAESAQRGALLAGVLASIGGAADDAVRAAVQLGAEVGARTYSKDFELEADALGTVIAFRAGFDPVVGARYFERIPDPGNRFLGTHPPNRQRVQTVRETMSSLR